MDRRPALVRVQDPRGVEHRGRWTRCRCATTPPLLVLCLVEARFPTGTHETYQVPLGLRPADEGWNERVIFENDDWTVYDALADPAAGRELLHAMRSNTELQSEQDEFIFRWAESAGAGLGGTVDVRPVGVEQSNSSIVFGDQLILKAFRKVEPGVNPELELLRFLSARGFPHIAPLAGWYEVEGRHISATLGILQEFLAGARDGWELALDELTSDPNGLLDRIEALGVVIGELHSALGSDNSDPAFAPDEPSTEALSILTADVDEQIERVFLDLPETDAVAPIRGRGQDVREKLNALSHVVRGRPGDPHARRPAPRPDHAHRARLGGARLRGRAGAAAARAAPEALAAARRGRDAAIVLLRDGGRGAAARARARRTAGRSARVSASWRATTTPWTERCCRPASRPPSSCWQSSSSRRPCTSCATS